ncbi:M20/M25/M40 family metallo-hydrolase [Chondromyces crocatus]|uniref:Aminopeptidase n=1 Tax=Chondromyces crocatus TaxID=52 RepID=A0A0K1EFJ8_CHOCO|nr:M20/M25/M40 family metallo-hydrolase [Chondromyces crocatus]AKT39472.1 aminopeptidase [Chondromyces crocatus]
MKNLATVIALGTCLGACAPLATSDTNDISDTSDTSDTPDLPADEAVLDDPAGPDAGGTWITIGTDAIEVIHEAMARGEITGELETYDTNAEATVLRVSEEQIPAITRVMHDELHRCGGYVAHDSFTQATRALRAPLRRETPQSALVSYTINNAATVNTLLAAVEEPRIRSTISTLSSYTTRYYTSQSGVNAASWLRDTWQGFTAGRSDASVALRQHSGYPQPSVILTIEGAQTPGEVIVLGAHLDSTTFASSPTAAAPGADDDASGIATLTEVARVILQSGYRPARTVKFIGYAAEEVGLRGSGDIAAQHLSAGINVIGVLQLDMTNYKGSAQDIALVTDNTNAAQNQFLRDLITRYTNYTTVNTTCGYGCSDHASWHSRGFVVSLPFESRVSDGNPHIHTSADTLAQSGGNANHALKFAKLAAAYVAELAKGSTGSTNPDPEPSGPITQTFTGTVGQNQNVYHGPFAGQPGTSFTASLTGTGDADLYVRFGAQPTTSTYQCRPYLNGSNESCALQFPAGNSPAYVMVRGYTSATYTLTVTYQP